MTIIEDLAEFSLGVRFADLPAEVVDESKRLLIDSLGCALGGHDTPKGRAGLQAGLAIGGGSEEATIVGSDRRSSVFGATFTLGEVINAQDFDAILPPGHVTPYVLPGVLTEGEREHVDGKALICAVAASHELSVRFSKAVDNLRDVRDGVLAMPEVLGYSSTIFGGVAGIGIVKSFVVDQMTNALGLAALIAPVNSFRSWTMHMPPTTLKYQSGGVLAQAALTAAHLALAGDHGDVEVLDDREFGFARFIATRKWAPEQIVDGLGQDWRFPSQLSYKPWPHARGSHGALTALAGIVAEHDLQPDEIQAVRAWGETFAATYPVWQNRDLVDVHDAQFSMVHALAMCAHRVPAGRAWQDPDVVFDKSVIDLMGRTSYEAHPDWASAVSAHPGSRPTRVEVDARGTTFSGECLYPKGSPSPDPNTTMSTDDIVEKFRVSASPMLSDHAITAAVESLLSLEDTQDVGAVFRLLVPGQD